MGWAFGFTDLSGVSIGRLHWATERKLTLPLNGLPIAGVELRLEDPLAQEVVDRDGDVLLKVYNPALALCFIGDLTAVDETGADQEHRLACSFAGPLWRLQKRLVGKSSTGYEADNDPGGIKAVIENLLAVANSDTNTGVEMGTFDTFYPISAGPWYYKPFAEVITELQASGSPFPIRNPENAASDLVALDYFDQTGSFALGTYSAPTGGPWTTVGDSDDYIVHDAGNVAQRIATSDASAIAGRWAISGASALTNTVSGVNWQASKAGATGYQLYAGPFARHSGTYPNENWLWAYIDLNANALALNKKIGATNTNIGIFNFPSGAGFAESEQYTIRLLVDDQGNYFVWHYQVSDSFPSPMISGQDDDLATGGALASGKVGFADAYVGASALTRNYDYFVGANYTAFQSFDFELAPKEPTGSPMKLADLNLAYQIGTLKPEVIFEYGTGSRSVKSYRRALNREGLLNQAYSLPSGFPSETDVRSSTDFAAITARGLFQDVVTSDVQHSELRQALVDRHVGIRKQPRQEVSFEPSQTAPVFGTDYIVGDYVTARAVVNGSVRYNGTVRVYGVDISIDENGKEEIVPRLVESG